MTVSLNDPWTLGGVRVPNRVVLAPLAGIGNIIGDDRDARCVVPDDDPGSNRRIPPDDRVTLGFAHPNDPVRRP